MTRSPLPNRRPCETVELDWSGQRYHLSLGRDSAGQVRELFCDGAKSGSDAEAIIDDALILASILLQHGTTAAEVWASLGRLSPDPASGRPSDEPASLIGAAIKMAARQ